MSELHGKPIGIVVLSGGMDSCVTASIASKSHTLALLHVQYGQRTARRELRAFNDIADALRCELRLVIEMSHFSKIGGSALTDLRLDVPTINDESDGKIPITYVPFRNANILSAAVSWAEIIGADSIFIGVNSLDFSGYPDCRPEFIEAFNHLIKTGINPSKPIMVKAPLQNMNKSQIIRLGYATGAPLEKTWSCYIQEDKACGLCESCRLRLKGFQEAGLADPISYDI